MIYSQAEFNICLEWGVVGVNLLAPICDGVIIVDVLSFSTSVEIATSRGAIVYPHRKGTQSTREFAQSVGAELAKKNRAAKISLSPQSMLSIPEGIKLVLPSPNGSTLSLSTGNVPTIAGCIRNARAVAESSKKLGNQIALIPAGERWPDGSLRPALEDLIGAGAIVYSLDGNCAPETHAARFAFEGVKQDMENLLLQCSSGKELVAHGYQQDVFLASELNVSSCVPLLQDGAYRAR